MKDEQKEYFKDALRIILMAVSIVTFLALFVMIVCGLVVNGLSFY